MDTGSVGKGRFKNYLFSTSVLWSSSQLWEDFFFFFFKHDLGSLKSPTKLVKTGKCSFSPPKQLLPHHGNSFHISVRLFSFTFAQGMSHSKKALWEYARLQNRFPFHPNGRFKILKWQWFCKLKSMIFEAPYFFFVNVNCIFDYKKLTKIVI